MGYKAYVENVIMESGLEETDELLEILESCGNINGIKIIEGYVIEKVSKSSSGRVINGRYVEDPIEKVYRLPGMRKMRKDRDEKAADSADISRWHAEALNQKLNFNENPEYEYSREFFRTCDELDKGNLIKGGIKLTVAVVGAGVAIRAILRKVNPNTAKQIKAQIKELEGDAKKVAKLCKNGEISAIEAKLKVKKIEAKIKKLEREAEKLAVTKAKETKESVDVTDLQLEIFEACESGSITDEDRDGLLKLLETGSIVESVEFDKKPWKSYPEFIRYTSNVSIDGTHIELDNSHEVSDETLKLYGEKLDSDSKLLKKDYKKITQEEFEKLLSQAEDWETPAKTVAELMKLAGGKPDTITYRHYKGKDESAFAIWFNSKAPFNQKFFGCHSFVIDVRIVNGKIDSVSSNLEG